MLKLFYSKAACSLAPRIVLEELGLSYEAVAVDLRQSPPPDFLKLNPLGAVPVLVMENGQPLTEVSVILQYLADLKPEAGLAPRQGTLERLRLQERLNFVATEIHKGYGPLWHVDSITQNLEARQVIRKFAIEELGERFDVIVEKMGSRPFVMPAGYSVADAYLFTVVSWSASLKVDLSRWPAIQAYLERVKSRPAVMRALKAEHLVR